MKHLPAASHTIQADEQLLATRTQDIVTPDIPTIDCYQSAGGWKSELFGSTPFNAEGKLYFKPGLLEIAGPDTQVIHLVNAPKKDPEFTRVLAKAIRDGGFRANGRWIPISKDLTIVRSETDSEALARKVEAFPKTQQPGTFACLDSSQFDAAMACTRIEDGQLVERDCLNDLLTGCDSLVVTSPLSESQWITLINRLHEITPLRTLQVAENVTLPKHVDLSDRVTAFAPNTEVTLVRNPKGVTYPPESFEYTITETDSPETLFANLSILSQRQMAFSQTFSPLANAILSGQPVVLKGLHSNPQVMSALTSLLATPPYLLISGRKVIVEKLNLQCEVPTGTRLPSCWKTLEKTDEPAPESTPWINSIPADLRPNQTRIASLDELFKRLKTIPPSAARTYPRARSLTSQLWTQIHQQLQREQQSDHSTTVASYHWRKALNDVIAKEYRGDPNVYGFVKTCINELFPDTQRGAEGDAFLDRDEVTQWFKEHRDISLYALQKNIWQLSRFMKGKPILKEAATFASSHRAITAELLPSLLSCLPTAEQAHYSKLYSCSAERTLPVRRRGGSQRKFIYNALISAGAQGRVKTNSPLHKQVVQLAFKISQLKPPTPELVEPVLKEFFTEEALSTEFSTLAEDLLSGNDTQYKQQRRVIRLAEQVKSAPIVFLRGEAGTGKSYTADLVAKQLTQGKEPVTLSLSPKHEQEDLFGQMHLKPNPVTIDRSQIQFSDASGLVWKVLCIESGSPQSANAIQITFDHDIKTRLKAALGDNEALYYQILDQFEDNQTVFEPGPILKWASIQDNPPVLILDEANLSKTGVLHPLLGLNDSPPTITVFGKKVELTAQHRIIMTGNPDHYQGRHADPLIRNGALNLFYKPFTPEFLAENVFKPSLPEAWPADMKSDVTVKTLKLYDAYKRILPKHTFGPRDLKDISARILCCCSTATEFTPSQMNEVIWQALEESLAGEIPEEQQKAFRALKHWYRSHQPCDSTASLKQQQQFEAFYEQLKTQSADSSFDFDLPSVKKLTQQLWLELEKNGGKSAVIVEGEAGRGKDALLNLMLPCWLQAQGKEPRFVRINASNDNWEEIKAYAEKMMVEGGILVISELNILAPELIEGLFNEVLGSANATDFRLITTVNPASYSGRMQFTEAMQSRCSKHVIGAYTEGELKSVLRKKYPEKPAFTDWLVSEHCKLSEQLEEANLMVRLPIQKLLDVAQRMVHIPEDHWPEMLNEQYLLAYQALDLDQDDEWQDAADLMRTNDNARKEERLCQIINQHSSTPVTVKLGFNPSTATYNPKTSELLLSDSEAVEQLASSAVQCLSQAAVQLDRVEQLENIITEDLAQIEEAIHHEQQASANSSAKEPEDSNPGLFARMYNLMPAQKLVSLLTGSLKSIGIRIFSILSPAKLAEIAKLLPFNKLQGLLKHASEKAIASALESMDDRQDQVAELMKKLPMEKIIKVLAHLDEDFIAKIMGFLPVDFVESLMKKLPDSLLKKFENMEKKLAEQISKQLDDALKSIPEEQLAKLQRLQQAVQKQSAAGTAADTETLQELSDMVDTELAARQFEEASSPEFAAMDDSALIELSRKLKATIAVNRKNTPKATSAVESEVPPTTRTTNAKKLLNRTTGWLANTLGKVSPNLETGQSEEARSLAKVVQERTPYINLLFRVSETTAVLGHAMELMYDRAETAIEKDALTDAEEEAHLKLMDIMIKKMEATSKASDTPQVIQKRGNEYNYAMIEIATYLHKQGKFSREGYQKVVARYCSQKNPYARDVAYHLAHELKGHEQYNSLAEELLDKYYNSQCTTVRDIPERAPEPIAVPEKLGEIVIPTLDKLMGVETPADEWGFQRKSKAPDGQRLARLQAPFPSPMPARGKNDVIMKLDLQELTEIAEDEVHLLSRKVRGLETNEQLAYFLTALKSYADKGNWKLVVPFAMSSIQFGIPGEWEKNVHTFRSGLYEPELLDYMAAFRLRNETPSRVSLATSLKVVPSELNEQRIKESLKQPNAVFLGPDQLRECFREFLKASHPT